MALKGRGQADHNFLVMGPWRHSQVNYDAYNLGPLKWSGDTALQFRRDVLKPFFDQYLKTDAPQADTPHAFIYNTGENHWDRFNNWPLACAQGCTAPLKPLYLEANFGLGFDKPAASDQAADSFVSDPAKPVPYLPRPVRFSDSDRWKQWLVTDQRSVADRTDVLTYQGPVLTSPVRISGAPIADLFAATTGTDADWVVKLIDVYPDEVPSQPEMGGYELAVSMDIFRGRYRESFEHPLRHPCRQDGAISIRAAHHQPRVPAGTSHHGADSVQLVSALRSQSADLCAEYFPGQAVGLCESHRDAVPLGRSSQLRAAAGSELTIPCDSGDVPGPLPRLRLGLDFLPSNDPEHPGLLIRDPLKFSDAMLLIPPQLVECLACFDGEQTTLDLRANLVRITGEIQIGDLEKHLVGHAYRGWLSRRRNFRSHSPGARGRIRRCTYARGRARRFRLSGQRRRSPQESFRIHARRTCRQPGFIDRHRGATCQSVRWLGIVSGRLFRDGSVASGPHIRRACTSHYGEPDRFGLTRKPFVTSFGEAKTDTRLVDELATGAPDSIRMEDYCHAIEHSIEFQVLFLQYLYGPNINILPILCGSFLRSIYQGGKPEGNEQGPAVLRWLGQSFGPGREQAVLGFGRGYGAHGPPLWRPNGGPRGRR